MGRMLITGGTGWLGSVIAAELGGRGHRLTYLVRGDRSRGRLADLLGPLAPGAEQIVLGDVTRPRCGVADAEVARLGGGVDAVLHLAAAVRFDEAAQGEVQVANVEGTRHALELAAAVGARTFLYMSSCGVAGDSAAFGERDLDIGQGFRNAYERSKLEGEKLAAGFSGRRLILRVPGMIGDSRTGESRFFTGTYYRVMAAYALLRDELWNEWSGGERRALEEDGIRFGEDGALRLPFHVPFKPGCDCAIVPQDWVASMTAELLEREAAEGTFHLVHPSPPPAGWALRFSLSHLRIEPPGEAPAPAAAGAPVGRWARFVRRALDRMARHHYPYLLAVPRFRSERLQPALGARYAPPRLDEALLGMVLDHAVRARFSS